MLTSYGKCRWKAGGVDYSCESRRSLMGEGLQGGVIFNIGKRKEEWKEQESEVWWQEET